MRLQANPRLRSEPLVKKGVKLELEALSAKKLTFITDTYLPEKIERKEWLA